MVTKYDKDYNYALKKVEKLTGNTETYGDDLEKVGRRLFGVKFHGVYPSDKIPKLNDLKPYAIINLDNSKQPGSHWVALAKKPHEEEALLYDSFGRGYRKIIPKLGFTGNGRIFNTDNDAEQKIKETNCGARCIAFLLIYDIYGWNASIQI